jgi:Tol biopolymer transport system component/DNA-binding winged helix-turn-helix (wHTH) protein
MSQPIKHFYEFDDFRIDRTERLLLRNGEIISLTQKAFDLLIVLVERRGGVIEKEDLIRQVWQGTFIEEGTLTQNIYTLRKVLGKTPDGADYIQTLPRRGYRFTAQVNERSGENADEVTTVSVLSDGSNAIKENLSKPANLLTNSEPVAALSESVGEADRPVTNKQDKPETLASAAQRLSLPEDHLGSRIVRHRALAAVGFFVLLGSLAFGLYKFFSQSKPQNRQPKITSFTNTGNLQCAAISPDGKYVVYASADKPRQSTLWIHQLSSHTNEQLIAPAEVRYHAVAFSRDGDYVYYVLDEPTSRVLYRIPMVGGTAKKLIEDVDGTVAFSPDSKQFAFRRVLNERREAALFIANAEGREEREIAVIKFPETFGDPAWSPDGKVIACAAGRTVSSLNMVVVGVNVQDKTVKQISAGRWQWIGQMAWLADASGLLMVAGESASAPYQIWQLDYKNGEAQKVTNDANYYSRLSMSADSSTIVALQRRQATNLWLIPAEDTSRAKQLTFGTGGYRGALSWTPDGKIVFDSDTGNAVTISILNADGSNAKPLLGDMTGHAFVGQAAVSPDGRYILYVSDATGARHIWRMNLDGTSPIQLTNGEGEDHPSCSPDGRWVVYTKLETKDSGKPMLWKVSIDGGEPEQLTDAFTVYPAVSPDGKLIACVYAENYSDDGRLAIFPFAGGKPVKVFQTGVQLAPLKWTPDGNGITYSENSINSSKIRIQPTGGGEPKTLIEFPADRIFGFDWSGDGKTIACVRGFWAANAMLIKEFKTE